VDDFFICKSLMLKNRSDSYNSFILILRKATAAPWYCSAIRPVGYWAKPFQFLNLLFCKAAFHSGLPICTSTTCFPFKNRVTWPFSLRMMIEFHSPAGFAGCEGAIISYNEPAKWLAFL